MGFIATENKGFRMNFENGLTISIQWGTMNYCEKKNLGAKYKDEMKEPIWESTSAEIAIFNDMDIIPVGKHDDVIGWCSANEVAKVIKIVSSTTDLDKMKSEIKKLNI